jgi:hypothetical protein
MPDTRTVKMIFKRNPLTKDHKEDPLKDRRITSNRIFVKLRLKTESSASRIEGNGKRSLRRP